MSDPFRPRSHPERESVDAAVKRYTAESDADPSVVAFVGRFYAGPSERYFAAWKAHQSALADAQRLSDAADAADEVFDTTFRLWVATVRGPKGKPIPQEIAALCGHLPGELVFLGYRDEVSATKRLFERLRDRPELAGGAAEREALQAATVALEQAVNADEDADRKAEAAGLVHRRAEKEFDQAYGKLRRTARATVGEEHLARLLVRFARAGSGRSGTGGT